MIDINLWQGLAFFEKYGTLSKAAEKLFISQPALSRSMNKLEEEVGVVLFNRSKNKITLLNTTSFPSFVTNKSMDLYKRKQSDCKVIIEVLDTEATVNYYSVILKENYKQFRALFEFIKNKAISRSI